ncbi:MAG TPA: hypothetical protein VG963_25630, partial [Polyangiaceae bacterium]|nr:hypothetical protein [Polyangiaceae bacterium]
ALTSLAFLTSMLGVWAAALAARRRFVAALAAFSFVFISIWLEEIQSVFGLVGEAIATPWLVVAFALCCWALSRPSSFTRRCLLLGGSGATAALAGLCKQTYLPMVAPLALWALAATLADQRPEAHSRWRRWGGLLALCAGWALPTIVVVLVYAIAGELGTFYYWFYRYNVDVYMAPFHDTPVPRTLYHWLSDNGYLTFSAMVLLSAVAGRHIGPLLRSFRQLPGAYAGRGFELSVIWLSLLGVAAGFSTLRMWPQYYLPPIPWFALLIGISFEQALGYSPHEAPSEPRPWRSLLVASVVLVAFCGGMLESTFSSLRNQKRKGAFADARPEQACEHINRLAPPGAPIFIWGFDGDLYITCQRHPASRYVYATLVAGIVPPDWRIHLEWSARNSIETLMSELDETHTPLILDSPARLHGVSMTQIKPLNRYLHEKYCEAGNFQSNDGRPISAWLRRDLCPKPADGHAGTSSP